MHVAKQKWFNSDVFQHIQSTVESIDLGHNKLTYLQGSTWDLLSVLNNVILIGNQLKCTCNLTTMLRSLDVEILLDCFLPYPEGENIDTEVFVQFPDEIHGRHMYSSCDGSCGNTAYMSSLGECRSCHSVPYGSLCSNYPQHHEEYVCTMLLMEKSEKPVGNKQLKCKESPCFQYPNQQCLMIGRKKNRCTLTKGGFGVTCMILVSFFSTNASFD